jgi:hypothetical protein
MNLIESEIISINEDEVIKVDDVISKLKESLPDCFIIPPQIDDNKIIVSDNKVLGNIIEITIDDWQCYLKKEKKLDVKHVAIQLPDGRIVRSNNDTITVEVVYEVIKKEKLQTISNLDSIIEEFKEISNAK